MTRKTRLHPTGVKELPSFVLGRSRPNKYDWSRNVYNWRSDNTRRIKAGCGRAAAGGKAHFATIGTSITTGYMGDAASPAWDMSHSWPVIMRNTLAAQGIPVGGSGFVATANEGVLPDPRWTVLSGTWGLPAAKLGYAWIASSGKALQYTTEIATTKVTVWYYTNSGAFTVNVNNLGAVTVTPSGVGVSVAKYELTGTFPAGTPVVVTTSSASPTYIIGAMASNATGLDVHNLAVATTLAGDWVSLTGGGLNDSHVGALVASGITPDAVFLEFGPNEKITGASISTFKSNMTTLRGYFASTSDIVLVGCPSWPDFSNELFELADTFDCPFIDVYSRFGGIGASDPGTANGMSQDPIAHVHPDKQCQASWGLNTAGVVAS